MATLVKPRYVRHRSLSRLRHSKKFNAFLTEQATRTGQTEAQLFDVLLAGGTYLDILAIADAP